MSDINIETDGQTTTISFNGNITSEEGEVLNEMMNLWQNEMIKYEMQIASELNISAEAAQDIVYLRSRSRWSQDKENYLIWLDQNQKTLPCMMEDFNVPEGFME
jgi:hypothetical protein